MIRRPRRSTLFPSPTLFRSAHRLQQARHDGQAEAGAAVRARVGGVGLREWVENQMAPRRIDRKSTRLNSSHSQISYAVFCLKKKKQPRTRTSVTKARQHLSS